MHFKMILDGLRFSPYVTFHPFKGFWELCREKRGNARSASVILFGVIVVLTLRRQWTAFMFNYNEASRFNIVVQVMSVLLPFMLWCISNWCITTLMDGEGSFTDIYTMSAYALLPVIFLNVPMIILSNVISLNEGMIYYFLDSLSLLWSGMLFLFGLMTIHQFTVAKTLATAAIALVGMVVIIFLFVLFFALNQQIINFVIIFYKELALRYDW